MFTTREELQSLLKQQRPHIDDLVVKRNELLSEVLFVSVLGSSSISPDPKRVL